MSGNAPLVIGFGNRWRGDDAAGPLAAERLAAAGYETVEIEADGTLLLEAWTGRTWVVVIDAMVSGTPPGSIRRFDRPDALPKGAFRSSTHLIGLAAAVDLARALGRLPDRLTVFGIEGADYGYGAPLSAAVDTSLTTMLLEIEKLISSDRSEKVCFDSA